MSSSDFRSRTVSALRPKPGLALEPSLTVAAAAKRMAAVSTDCALIVSESGEHRGIFTDTDAARKVVAKGLDPETTNVTDVMTANPMCVKSSEVAVE